MKKYFVPFLFPFLLCAEPISDFPDPYPQIYEMTQVLPENLWGWYRHAKFQEICAEKHIRIAVEIGVWLGNFTVYLAELLPPDAKLFAVDHWKGSSEHQYDYAQWLPTLYQQFLSNVIHAKLTDKIVPVRMDSLDAAKKFAALQIRPDLVYIDASHDYWAVYNDISAWYPLLSETGILGGDDWHLGDISKAVRAFAAENNLKVYHQGEFWWVERIL